MIISKDTEEVLQFLDYMTGNDMRKRQDLAVILELGATLGESELVSDIIFRGKYLWNVYNTLKKSTSSTEGFEKLQAEYNTTSDSLLEMLRRLTSDADNESIDRFGKTYFQDSQGSQRNLIDLSHDLSELKELMNSMKNRANP